MAHDAKHNPRNRVGRYSGAGAAGVTEVVPTEREAARGLRPISISGGRSWTGWGLAALALFGAGLGAYAAKRARERRSVGARLRRWAGID